MCTTVLCCERVRFYSIFCCNFLADSMSKADPLPNDRFEPGGFCARTRLLHVFLLSPFVPMYISSIFHIDVRLRSVTERPFSTKYLNLQVHADYEYCRQPWLDAHAELHSDVDECAGESPGRTTSARLSLETRVGAYCRSGRM